jgi:hypothetical protein
VFRDLVECCGQKPASDSDKQSRRSASENKEDDTRKVLELPLEDRKEEVASLVEYLHQPERFLESVVPIVTKEGTDRVLLLAPIAFKYDMQGNGPLSLLHGVYKRPVTGNDTGTYTVAQE